MESDLQQHRPNRSVHLDEHQTKQMNSGLTRYQSAPSSYFSSFLDRDSLEEFLNRPTSPETERIFDRFLKSSENRNSTNTFFDQSFLEKKEKSTSGIKREREDHQIPETEEMVNRKQSASGSVSGPGGFSKPQLDRGSGSNLIRQSSSPAGFLSSVDIENAYAAVMRGMGDISGGNTNYTINKKEEASSFSTSGSRPLLSTSGLKDPMSETDNELNYSLPELPPRTLSGSLSRSSWDENLDSKTLTRGDRSLSGGLYQSETKIEQNAGSAKRPPLAHHLSLPKSMSDIEKLLESSDSVPWKIRAKRGCATHPRSIAERVRRTKISDRMKRLQELVPNMDKQTNTSDMLDLAVEYIKDLQKQHEILLQNGAMCTCSSTQPKETKD